MGARAQLGLLLLLVLARPAQLKRRRSGPRPPARPPSYTFEDERRETRPRLALCIVGLFRDHRERVLPSLRTRLFNSTEWRTDVFIEAWSTLGANRVARLRSGTDQTGGPLDPQWLAEYPNLVSLKVERTPHNVSRHFHGLDLPPALVRANANSYGSTLPNLRRMQQCHAAVRAWEDSSGFRYDVIVKMRPDYVCGGSTWAALLVAVRQVLAHGRDPLAQPFPFFHEHGWPAVMVSDKFAVGTSAAMAYYLNAWNRLPRLFADPRLRDANGRANHLVGEKLMKVYMRDAPFDHMQTFCCISPRQRRKKGRCALDFKPGGVLHRYFHGPRNASLHGTGALDMDGALGDDDDASATDGAEAGAVDADDGAEPPSEVVERATRPDAQWQPRRTATGMLSSLAGRHPMASAGPAASWTQPFGPRA
jgi:hypothetical protein